MEEASVSCPEVLEARLGRGRYLGRPHTNSCQGILRESILVKFDHVKLISSRAAASAGGGLVGGGGRRQT